MTMLTLTGPDKLEVGDRVYIDGKFTYEVIERPSVPFDNQQSLEVHIRYRDGGTSTRTFAADVSWDSLDITVVRVRPRPEQN